MITKVLGPYTKRDGRQFVIVHYDDKKRRHVSYPKHLLEQYLGRELDPDQETVHHKDGNFNNNAIENLEILSRSEHSKKDSKKIREWTATCPWCSKRFHLSPSQIAHRQRKSIKQAGPFCSYQCMGKYNMERRYRNCDRVVAEQKKVYERRGTII